MTKDQLESYRVVAEDAQYNTNTMMYGEIIFVEATVHGTDQDVGEPSQNRHGEGTCRTMKRPRKSWLRTRMGM
jgi:hypothetical protein